MATNRAGPATPIAGRSSPCCFFGIIATTITRTSTLSCRTPTPPPLMAFAHSSPTYGPNFFNIPSFRYPHRVSLGHRHIPRRLSGRRAEESKEQEATNKECGGGGQAQGERGGGEPFRRRASPLVCECINSRAFSAGVASGFAQQDAAEMGATGSEWGLTGA